MSSNLPTIMIRTKKETIEKFRKIATENKRSMSKEAEKLIENHIKEYETRNGEITIEE